MGEAYSRSDHVLGPAYGFALYNNNEHACTAANRPDADNTPWVKLPRRFQPAEEAENCGTYDDSSEDNACAQTWFRLEGSLNNAEPACYSSNEPWAANSPWQEMGQLWQLYFHPVSRTEEGVLKMIVQKLLMMVLKFIGFRSCCC